ncbi:carboxylesterase [Penaeus vannamei]|uniref:Carboxylesterase n=1 Tax=Penaeus vannamei TaxID=6689 RepID=A0A3R7MG38_PENVA|nr:carboxylesterase [Penaeus vannamei]
MAFQPNRTDLPVMVWLPQGGFISDATPLFQPEFLLAKDVVLVVLQHRLGVLGFLSTEDAELPGNLGLKDQAMALRWVQDNIRDLGGDPDKVTIFGQTRGARLCTTTCCLPCPVSKSISWPAVVPIRDVGKRPLPASHHAVGGGAVSLGAPGGPPAGGLGFGRMVGCPATPDAANSTALVDCLRDVPVEQLMAVTPYITVSKLLLPVRPDARAWTANSSAHPATLIREGRYNRVDVLSGVTRDGAPSTQREGRRWLRPRSHKCHFNHL